MRWFKKYLWNVAIACVGVLFLLTCLACIPTSAASAHDGTSGLATPGTVVVQATPTGDATVTALNKEKLEQEVQQLKEQNEPDFFGWLRMNASILLSTLVVVIGGLIGLFRWLGDRRDTQDKELKNQQNEREKRAEERFQAAVTGLGDDKEGARIGAAILLRTFLRPGYEQFYIQTFDLAVANLRLPRTPHLPEDSDASLPLSTLSQALIVAFKEAFSLARKQNKRDPQSLDATGIQLDNAYLRGTDLKQVWMPVASLRKVDLVGAMLTQANLSKANLIEAKLRGANLSNAKLHGADLSKADLSEADLNKAVFIGATLTQANLSKANLIEAMLNSATLIETALVEANLSRAELSGATLTEAVLIGATLTQANLVGANLSGAYLNRTTLTQADLREANFSNTKMIEAMLNSADLTEANLSGAYLNRTTLAQANLWGADLSNANLSEANLRGAKLNNANLSLANLSLADLNETDIENALSLKGTVLLQVNGLTKDQKVSCQEKGAIIDEDSATGSFQSNLAPSSPSQSNDAQTSSTPSTQGSTPLADTHGSSAVSSLHQDSKP